MSRRLVRSLLAGHAAGAGLLLATLGSALAGQQVTASVLREIIPGARINLDTPIGTVVPISYHEDGRIEGQAGAVAFFLGTKSDSGKWWLKGEFLCHQWKVWFEGRPKCFEIRRAADRRILWRNEDGESGSGTIVAMGERRQQASLSGEPSLLGAKSIANSVEAPPSVQPIPPRPAEISASSRQQQLAAPPVQPVRTVARADPAKATRHRPATSGTPQKAADPRSLPGQVYKVVDVYHRDVLNVRSGPGIRHPVVAWFKPDETGINVAGACRGQWCPVQFASKTGWVNQHYLAPLTTPQSKKVPVSRAQRQLFRVTNVRSDDVLNIRAGASESAAIVGIIPHNGSRVEVVGACAGEWCPVQYAGQSGWSNRYYLTPTR